MLNRLWEENKRFLLIAGSGLAVFLILNSIIGGYISMVDGVVKKSSLLAKECRDLLSQVKPLSAEKKRLEELTAHETQLRKELELPPEKELEKFDKTSPLLQFNGAIDRAWGVAKEKANQVGLVVPEKLGPNDFGADKQADQHDYASHYTFLSVARRALVSLIDAGMTEIARPQLEDEEALEVIKDDSSVQCLLRTVRFKVAGPYDSYLKLLKSLQAPESFLQVGVSLSTPKGTTDDRTVRGDLRFTALSLLEGEKVPEKTGVKRPSAPRRAR